MARLTSVHDDGQNGEEANTITPLELPALVPVS